MWFILGGHLCRSFEDLQRHLLQLYIYSCHTFSPPTRKRSTAARLMHSFSQRPSRRSLMDTPALRGTEQHDPSGKLILHCLKGALPPTRSVVTDAAPRETSPWRGKTEKGRGSEQQRKGRDKKVRGRENAKDGGAGDGCWEEDKLTICHYFCILNGFIQT